jgi:hypothetical protein
MYLHITFIFSDKRTSVYVKISYTNFHRYEICRSNETSHFGNMIKYTMSDRVGTYYGEIVENMYNNCIFFHYIPYSQPDGMKPYKAVFNQVCI